MAFPGQLKVDYVRVYQDASTAMSADNSTMVCSPPNMPTEEYIKAHAGDYAGAPNAALVLTMQFWHDVGWDEWLRDSDELLTQPRSAVWQGRRSRR